ncbi:MAG: LysR family transcriptional regulator, partial [Pseudobdellovibrionaceae bacterium]
MDKVPIHLLNAFIIFNDSKNIMEAADSLGITQPALSKQLKQLEALMPNKVYSLSGRKKVLTSFGRDLHERIKERIGNIQEVIHQTNTLHSDTNNAKIRIAGRRGILDRISRHLQNFDGSLFFKESSNDLIIDSLMKFNTEIGIIHSIPNTYELIAKPLFKEEFQLVVPKKFILQKPTFGETLISKLMQLPCIGYKPEDEIISAVCSSNSVDAKKIRMVRATENYTSIAEMVDAKIGWAIIPSYIEISDARSWSISIPTKALPARQFFLVYRPELTSAVWFKD